MRSSDSGLVVIIGDLRESADYLKWIFKNKKRRAETFETHAVFFEAFMDELGNAIRILEWLRDEEKRR